MHPRLRPYCISDAKLSDPERIQALDSKEKLGAYVFSDGCDAPDAASAIDRLGAHATTSLYCPGSQASHADVLHCRCDAAMTVPGLMQHPTQTHGLNLPFMELRDGKLSLRKRKGDAKGKLGITSHPKLADSKQIWTAEGDAVIIKLRGKNTL